MWLHDLSIMHSEKDVFRLCRLPKSCFMEAECPYREFRSSDSWFMFCRFLKSNEVAFSSSLHSRNAHTPEQELLFWKNGYFVVRTVHVEMSFQCLVKQFHFLICSSTSFQVGICSFPFQSTAKRHSKLQRPLHYGRALMSFKFISSCFQSQPGLLQCYWWER